MLKLSRIGVTIMPPMPAFYSHPESIDDMINHIVVRILDQFSIAVDFSGRWTGEMGNPAKLVKPGNARQAEASTSDCSADAPRLIRSDSGEFA